MTVKTCISCVFFENTGHTTEYGKCSKVWKVAPQINRVTGRADRGEHWFAATQRCASGSCGPSGKLWKSRIPVKEKPVEPKRPNIVYRAANRLLRMFR